MSIIQHWLNPITKRYWKNSRLNQISRKIMPNLISNRDSKKNADQIQYRFNVGKNPGQLQYRIWTIHHSFPKMTKKVWLDRMTWLSRDGHSGSCLTHVPAERRKAALLFRFGSKRWWWWRAMKVWLTNFEGDILFFPIIFHSKYVFW